MSVVRLFLMILWTFSLMLIAPLFIPFTFNRQFPLLVARVAFSPILLKIAGIKLSVTGKENVPLNRPVIFVANHCSHLDIGVLCRSLPVNLHFIGKKELKWVPVVGWYMWVAGHIFIDRSNKKKAINSLKIAAQKINSGKCVVMYPEGTRSKDGKVQTFKKGAFHLALESDVDVVPVSIKGTFNVWPANSSKITPGKVKVTIGKPLKINNYTKQSVQTFIDDARNAIVKMQES